MYLHIWFEFENKGHVVKKINFQSKGATITFFWTKKTGADFFKADFVYLRKLIQQREE